MNFGFKNLYKACLDKSSLVGGSRTWRVNCIFIFQTLEVQTQSSDYSIGAAQPVVKVQAINGNRRVISNGITQSGDMENGAGEPQPVIRAPVAANVRSFPGDRLIGVNNSFATVETRRELEPNCVPQLFLGWLLETRRSAIGRFFFTVCCDNPRSLCESYLDPVFLPFLKWRISPYLLARYTFLSCT